MANLVATSSGVSSISSTQLTESGFSTTPLTAGRGGESGEGEAAGDGGESRVGDVERTESPDDVRRIGVRSKQLYDSSRVTAWKRNTHLTFNFSVILTFCYLRNFISGENCVIYILNKIKRHKRPSLQIPRTST